MPISAGDFDIVIPADFIISILSSAPPLPPEIIAPACPILLPGGAVRPAIKPTIGFFIFSEQLSDELRFCLVLLFSFCGGVQPAALISGATVHSPTKLHLGATNGFMYQGSQSGSVFGPPIVAAIVTQTGKWEPAGWLLFSLTCISLLAVALMRKYEKRIEDKY